MTSNLPAAATRPALDRPEVIATFFHGLSDPTRVRILELLAGGPMTVTEIVGAVGLAQGRVSSHLSCLRWCGYVEATVEGRYNRYRLVDERVRDILRLGEAIVHDNADRLTSCLVLATELDAEGDEGGAPPGGLPAAGTRGG
ncbi:MAG: winged helix-turn-helix transcriptional regulator [Chloroflexi bacterium]|nr:winged helix-turn-helix transcriptional regulator [Chloroflexota bacterium]